MGLVSIIAAILLQKFRPPREPDALSGWLARLAGAIEHHFNAGAAQHGVLAWLALMLAVCVPVTLVHYACLTWAPELAWLWAIAVLYVAIRFRSVLGELGAIQKALLKDDLDTARERLGRWLGRSALQYDSSQLARAAIERAVVESYRGFFATTFWFVVLPGPAGALLYRAAQAAAEHWREVPAAQGGDPTSGGFGAFADLVADLLDWIPTRLAGVSFAVVGDFEDALYCWRTQAQGWADPGEGIVLATAAGALGVRLGDALAESAGVRFRPSIGLGEAADAEYLSSCEGLLWRAALFWLLVMLLFSLGLWLA